MPAPEVAVLLPCRNEAACIAKVVNDFKTALPKAAVYVYDNASTDNTAREAESAGAEVRHEPRPGKGHVIRRMFSEIEADIYVLSDGDDTYEAACAPDMIHRLQKENLDMLVGTRQPAEGEEVFRAGHRAGNRFFNCILKHLFRSSFTDVFSGYRIFSRRFISGFPALASGFETELEMSVHSLDLNLPVGEIPTPYRARPAETESKLNTWRDGARILFSLFRLLKDVRPFFFFFSLGSLFLAVALFLGIPLVMTYLQTGLVPRVPTAILTTGLVILGGLSYICALVLDSLSNTRREIKTLLLDKAIS